MALKVDLHKNDLTRAIQLSISSLKRSLKNQHNPGIAHFIEEDIKRYTDAINTLTEVK